MASCEGIYRELGWAPTLVGEPGQLDAITRQHLAVTGYDVHLTGDNLQGDLLTNVHTDPKVLLLRQHTLYDYTQPLRLDEQALVIGHIISYGMCDLARNQPEEIDEAATMKDPRDQLVTTAPVFPEYGAFADWEEQLRKASTAKGDPLGAAMIAGYDGGRPTSLADRHSHTSFFNFTGDYVTVGYIPNSGSNKLYFSQLPQ